MIKTYRTVQQWDHWLTHPLGIHLLKAEQTFLSSVLAERYGKHALLIGVPHQHVLLECSVMSMQIMLTPLINKQKHDKCIESEYNNLPIIPGSVDLVILPHTLEFVDNPHQLLSEACRAVKPEGLIMIFGFNPFSLWGLKKWLMRNKNMPWQGNFIHPNQIKSWLKLVEFELIKQDALLHSPPIIHAGIYQKLGFLEWLGKKIHSPFGGVYVLTARAKLIPLTPIKLRWKQKLSALHATIPGPTMRDRIL